MEGVKIMFKNKKSFIWLVIIVAIAALSLRGFLKKKPHKEIPPRPVETALAIEQDAQYYIDSFGNLYPPNDVNIIAQVTGEIKEVNFVEGSEVKKEDLLFTIDPSPYQATLDKARAALMDDLADLKLKKITLERNKKLFEKELISQQDFDTYQTDFSSAEAKVRLDAAEVELAKINLEYCYVRSPIDGLTGKRQVDLGNIVSANAGPTLVNVKTIDPLFVDFTIPEGDLPEVRKAMQEGKLKVELTLGDDATHTYTGELELIDNTVDNTTGTVLLRASVSNKERALWAGQFVKVRLILGIDKGAVLVPYDAVQLGQKGSYLFVITADNKADLRIVNVGMRQKDFIVIKDGVKKGEKVVVFGQMGLSPQAKVIEASQLKEQK
jgi:multidrug efflux system membrane fusion protein